MPTFPAVVSLVLVFACLGCDTPPTPTEESELRDVGVRVGAVGIITRGGGAQEVLDAYTKSCAEWHYGPSYSSIVEGGCGMSSSAGYPGQTFKLTKSGFITKVRFMGRFFDDQPATMSLWRIDGNGLPTTLLKRVHNIVRDADFYFTWTLPANRRNGVVAYALARYAVSIKWEDFRTSVYAEYGKNPAEPPPNTSSDDSLHPYPFGHPLWHYPGSGWEKLSSDDDPFDFTFEVYVTTD